MPNIGPMELIVVLVIALLVLGPKRLPQAGKSLGVKLYNCFIPKLSLAWAPDAFTKQGLEFFAAQDSGSTAIADIYVGE